MTRRPAASIVANPVLVGAVTLLVVVVAVFLAYNANNGLPFVPTQTLYAELPNGADLNKGVEVREGGYRIGVVDQLEPGPPAGRQRRRARPPQARRVRRARSRRTRSVVVRPRSPLALKIVQFERGDGAAQSFEDGDHIPADQSEVRTDLDELYDLYDAPTREGVKGNLARLRRRVHRPRPATSTRRSSRCPSCSASCEPVMSNLADERTDLPSFFKELGDTTRVVAPVAREYARSFGTQADTFDAINRDPEALQGDDREEPADDGRLDRLVPRPAPAAARDDAAVARAQPRVARPARPRCRRSTTRSRPRRRCIKPLGRAQRRDSQDALGGAAATSPRRRRPTARCAA